MVVKSDKLIKQNFIETVKKMSNNAHIQWLTQSLTAEDHKWCRGSSGWPVTLTVQVIQQQQPIMQKVCGG